MLLALLVLVPATLAVLPLRRIEAMPSLCLFHLATGRSCPGCGLTRAIIAALHLQFHRAVWHNPLVVVAGPILLWIWARNILRAVRVLGWWRPSAVTSAANRCC